MTRTIAWLRDHRLLPEAYLWGFAHTYKFSQARPAFLNGEYRTTGWPQFFPLTFLMKTTIPALALGSVGILLFVSRSRNRPGRTGIGRFQRAAPLLILLFIYWAMAVRTHLNIGHRHILPTYPIIYVFAGAGIAWLFCGEIRRWGRIVAAIAMISQAVDSLAARPFYISYFNPVAGGPAAGWRHLVDSSWDWGQGLPDLDTWLARKNDAGDSGPVYLTYFGTDSPRARNLPVIRFADDLNDYGPRTYPTIPRGGWFVISATHYQRVYLHLTGPWDREREQLYRQLQAELVQPAGSAPAAEGGTADRASLLRDAQDFELLMFGRLCFYLSDRAPFTVIGGSLLVFRLTDAEVAYALNAPFENFRPAEDAGGTPP